MTKLLTVKDIAERYNCSEKTARRYIQRMDHMEKPLRVTEQAVEQWENERTVWIGNDTPSFKRTNVKRKPGPIFISRVRKGASA